MKRIDLLKLTGTLALAAGAALLAMGSRPQPVAAVASAPVLEERKQPMRFQWIDCKPNCTGWISAVGIVTGDTPRAFEDFARDRSLQNATIVLDSSGGSVNDAIALGRRWRKLGLRTTVGISMEIATANGYRSAIQPQAYCESMCAFLLLSGSMRHVPDGARVRVHQIWMGDRAENAKAASYSAQDLMIVERDIGRLAKYTFEMGGTGELLSLALSVPPWEDLHQLSRNELHETNLNTHDALAALLPPLGEAGAAMVRLTPKPNQERFPSEAAAASDKAPAAVKATQTAEAGLATGSIRAGSGAAQQQ